MALFSVSVLATLNVPREMRDLLRQQVQATEHVAECTDRVAAALEALVAKANEPDPPADEQAAVDALVATLAASNTTLADEVQKILAAHP